MSPRMHIRQGQSTSVVTVNQESANDIVKSVKAGQWIAVNTPNGTAHINGATVDSIEVERD